MYFYYIIPRTRTMLVRDALSRILKNIHNFPCMFHFLFIYSNQYENSRRTFGRFGGSFVASPKRRRFGIYGFTAGPNRAVKSTTGGASISMQRVSLYVCPEIPFQLAHEHAHRSTVHVLRLYKPNGRAVEKAYGRSPRTGKC